MLSSRPWPVCFSVLIAVLLILAGGARGAYLFNVPQKLRQPNGEILKCLASGDEFYNWLHDAAGYTIVQDPVSGWYVYAESDPEGDLRPSAHVAGRVDPRRAGLGKGLRLAPQKIMARRQSLLRMQSEFEGEAGPSPAPRTGTLNNLAVFIRFSGESEFTDDPTVFTSKLNASGASDKSMFTYFKDVSYNALSITTTLYPAPAATVLSYQDAHPRGYYQPYNAATNTIGYSGGNNNTERTIREHALLAAAVTAIASQVPSGLAIDGDNDGNVDNITFVVSGSAGGWNEILWPHRWSLYSQTVYIRGKRAYTYNLHLGASFSVGTLCHEMFHSLGAPDLYHYTSNGVNPAGFWDIMQWSAPGGPQHMSAYMKWKYGTWIASLPEITVSGTYTLQPLTSSSGNCYKIRSPYSSTEYFVVEYRKNSGLFDSCLASYCGYDEGLVVYRINPALTGNANGPPDEVYVYRPGGTLSADGTLEDAAFSSGSGRTAINDSTNPPSFLTAGGAGGLNISDVGAAGSTISFYVAIPTGSATMSLSKNSFTFGAIQNGAATPAETSILRNTGSGTMSWTATRSADWIAVSPASGSGGAALSIGIARTNLSPGSYSGTVVVAAAGATNTPQTIYVNYTVYASGGDAGPFGTFETPANGAAVASSIPVTGWALDDIGMQSVKIYRGTGFSNRIYIGEAVFVEGARADVAAAYPGYPQKTRAGWGYMLLTNFLPNGGNGNFTLLAYAVDLTGHEVLLGSKSITCNNAGAVLPFGAIDTPTQGGTASGNAFFNFGWALTPQPNSIATNGSTIYVWVDGAALGHPAYNNYRADIAGLFPGYANSSGAVGVYTLNTTAFADGVHTIVWSVQDSAGHADGIGSRYFSVLNAVGGASPEAAAGAGGVAGLESVDGVQNGAAGAGGGTAGAGGVRVEGGAEGAVGAEGGTVGMGSAAGSQSAVAGMNGSAGRTAAGLASMPDDMRSPVYVRRGMAMDAPVELATPENDGSIRIAIPEVTRVAVYLNEAAAGETETEMIERGARMLLKRGAEKSARYEAFEMALGELRPLPIGASFDPVDGVLYWQPGPGFLGEYAFVVVDRRTLTKKTIGVSIRSR